MKRLSFRLRIALLSALLAGSALIGFGLVSGWLVYKAKLSRIDDGIKNQLLRESDRPRPDQHWESYASSLPATFSTDNPKDIAILVQKTTQAKVYQSSTWNSNLTLATTFPSSPISAIGFLSPPVESSSQPPDDFARPVTPSAPPNRPPHNPGEITRSRPGDPSARPVDLPIDREGNPQEAPIGLPPGEPPRELPQRAQFSPLATHLINQESWRLGAVTSPSIRLAIGVNLRQIETEMNTIRNAYLISIPLLLALIAIGAWWISGNVLKPIRQVTETLRQVTAQGLDQRVSVVDSDGEFIELLTVFNQMMESLERSFTQASRFSADAAHELKTPLSILQGELERTLHAAPPGSELQQRLSRLLDEVAHLGAIVRKLLLLSLADAGQMRLYKLDVNLSHLLTDLVEDIEMLAPELEVRSQIDHNLILSADQSLLMQVLQNLVNNAIKYNLSEGWIHILAKRQNNQVWVTIVNKSKDISPQERSRIFDRFHRGDPAHTHQIEGLGLGLSLSQEIAYAHGGNLTIDETPPGQTSFTLKIGRASCRERVYCVV